MGWFRDDAPGHEGFCVALVELEARPGSGLLRELSYPADDTPRGPIFDAQAGCDCGWRSPRLTVPSFRAAHWRPFTVQLQDEDTERLASLWGEHVELEIAREAVNRRGAGELLAPLLAEFRGHVLELLEGLYRRRHG